MENEEGVRWAREKAKRISQDVLSGELSVLEGARAPSGVLASNRGVYQNYITSDADLFTIVAVEGETDTLPLGEVRKLWAPAALLEKDVVISRCEQLYGERVRGVCRRILAKVAERPESDA